MSITWAEAQRLRRHLRDLEAARRHTHVWRFVAGSPKTRCCKVCGLTQQRGSRQWQTIGAGKAAAA